VEPDFYPDTRPRAATIRSRVMLEVASELAGDPAWVPNQARVQLRRQGASEWEMTLFGSDAPSAVQEVASGETSFAIINPAVMAAVARTGATPFPEPVELEAIGTIPSFDQLGIAAAAHTSIRSLGDLASHRGPLRVSLRGERPDHSIHAVLTHVLEAAGTNLDLLVEHGAALLYQTGIPHQPPRSEAIARGDVDVIVDEGIYNWAETAAGLGFNFLPLEGAILERLEAMGHRSGVLRASRYPSLPHDVATIDFSGFLIYTHARVADDVVRAFCAALERRSDRIPWQGGPGLPLSHMLSDSVDAPLPIPLHPAARAYWEERGLLG
jgi:hypothetical protein